MQLHHAGWYSTRLGLRNAATGKEISRYHIPEILALLLTPKPHKAKEKKLVLEKHDCLSLDIVICFD